MRISRISLALTFALLAGQTAYADRDDQVCMDVNHCVIILENHAADSFDYAVLGDEFLRFGAKGKDGLMLMVASGDPVLETRALQILAKGNFRYSPDDQREVVGLWPAEDRVEHAKVLRNIMSPLVRAAMIDTLDHPDPQVRSLSRDILGDAVKAKLKFPMRSGDYNKLLRAALAEPHPALIELLGNFPSNQTTPAFARLLRSGDDASVMVAYEKLYAADKEQAFKVLVGVIYDLKDDELPAALAISNMLRKRNETRKDRFYLKFAKDLSEDKDLGNAGRAVGYDALMVSQGIKTTPRLLDNVIGRANYKYLLENYERDVQPYVSYLEYLSSDNADTYIDALNNYFSSDRQISLNGNNYASFIAHLGALNSPLAQDIVKQAISDKRDFNIITLAIISAGQQNQKSLLPEIRKLGHTHPVSEVRAAAQIALEDLKKPNSALSQKIPKSVLWGHRKPEGIATLNKNTPYCRFDGLDFEKLSKGMPYFTPAKLNAGLTTGIHNNPSSAAEMQSGWLAGYNYGEWGGGLVFYDYDKGASAPLLDENVIAIIPTQKLPLGQFSKSFWVITGLSHLGISYGNVYRVTQTDEGFSVNLHAALPGPAKRIEINSDESVSLDFVDYDYIKRNPNFKIMREQYNPPLLLEPNGTIRRLCEDGLQKRTDATP